MNELKTKFENWAMKIQTNFIESPLFQPIGLELSCTALVLETKEDYQIDFSSEITEDMYPIAYYRPDTDSIHVFIEHRCFNIRESDAEKYAFFLFCLFHEANHKILFHIKRGKDKEATLWNIAADMEIHNMLYVYYQIMKNNQIHKMSNIWYNLNSYIVHFLFEKKDKVKNEGLFEKEYLQNVAEEIYTDLQNSKVEEVKSFEGTAKSNSSDGDAVKVKVTVTKYTSKGGKKFTTTNIEFPKGFEKTNQDKENSALARKTMMENTLQKEFNENARDRGFDESLCSIFLKKLFKVRIDWKKILKSSLLTALEKSEYFTWAKPRTSLFGLQDSIYLPSQCEDETKYGTVIIARDESGSMTNDECSKAASIILEAKDFYDKIIVLKHDVKIVSVDEFDEVDENVKDMLLTRKSNGGTSHKEVFEYIRDYSKKEDEMISCCIFITDLMSDIEETQHIIKDNIPRIYICPQGCINEDHTNIKGKIIGIE